jgi:hypothetical protein
MTGPRNAAGCTPASCQTDPAEGWGCWAPGGNQISIRRPLGPHANELFVSRFVDAASMTRIHLEFLRDLDRRSGLSLRQSTLQYPAQSYGARRLSAVRHCSPNQPLGRRHQNLLCIVRRVGAYAGALRAFDATLHWLAGG